MKPLATNEWLGVDVSSDCKFNQALSVILDYGAIHPGELS